MAILVATPPNTNIISGVVVVVVLTNQKYSQPDSIILSVRPTKSRFGRLNTLVKDESREIESQ